jgi:ATP-GRASP peptide maturase of grasp-with-spasm system
MILILSYAYFEPSTDEIINWLDFYGLPWTRLNGLDFVKSLQIDDKNDMTCKFNGIDLSEVKIVWFRRWLSSHCLKQLFEFDDFNSNDRNFVVQIKHFLKSEMNCLFEYFFSSLPKELVYGRISNIEINKLSVLKEAQNVGLNIPRTRICTSRESFSEFKENSKTIITKAIGNATTIKVDGKIYKGFTNAVNEIPNEITNSFFPTLFQELVEKKYEIRSFFNDETFYSMAIFSQDDKETSVDFRKYNYEYPNRMVAYKLPNYIETKLALVAKHFNLNCCSFDLIKNKNGDFIFLEVNPGGQFGMVSVPCNYNLNKEIAKTFKKRYEK